MVTHLSICFSGGQQVRWAIQLGGYALCNSVRPCVNVMSRVEHLHSLDDVTQMVMQSPGVGGNNNMALTANKSHLLKISEHLLTLSNRQSTKRPIDHGLGNVYIKTKLLSKNKQLLQQTLEFAPGNS